MKNLLFSACIPLEKIGRKLMANQMVLIRIMGESDIIDVTMREVLGSSALLVGLDDADQINLLGHWMDQNLGAALGESATHLDAREQIASSIISRSSLVKALDGGANFVLLTILREKWPVGSKAKLKTIADKVKANHTYLGHVCATSKLENLDDQVALKKEETKQLTTALTFYRANRRQFASSSAVQGLIQP